MLFAFLSQAESSCLTFVHSLSQCASTAVRFRSTCLSRFASTAFGMPARATSARGQKNGGRVCRPSFQLTGSVISGPIPYSLFAKGRLLDESSPTEMWAIRCAGYRPRRVWLSAESRSAKCSWVILVPRIGALSWCKHGAHLPRQGRIAREYSVANLWAIRISALEEPRNAKTPTCSLNGSVAEKSA